MIAKILKLARNLVFVWARLLVVLTLTFNKAECFFPCLIRDETPGGSSRNICKLEMDSAIPARYSSLVRSVCESGPGKGYFLFGCETRLAVGASRGKRNRIPEFVAVSE